MRNEKLKNDQLTVNFKSLLSKIIYNKLITLYYYTGKGGLRQVMLHRYIRLYHMLSRIKLSLRGGETDAAVSLDIYDGIAALPGVARNDRLV